MMFNASIDSESGSRIAIVIWALTWLPGLALATWRAERHLRVRHVSRALAEFSALLLVPLSAFALYAVSDAQRYAQARNESTSWGILLSVAQVGIPYAVSAAYLLFASRPGAGSTTAARWWIALLAGLLSLPVLVPGLLMAQFMVFVGT